MHFQLTNEFESSRPFIENRQINPDNTTTDDDLKMNCAT